MFKTLLALVFTLLLGGCFNTNSYLEQDVKSGTKIFAEEDTYVLMGLRAEETQEFAAAASIFDTLYLQAQKREYLYRSLQDALLAKDNAYVLQKADAYLDGELEDYVLVRLKIYAYMQLEELEEAKELAIMLVTLINEEADYTLVSDIYIAQKKFDMAMKYLESAYVKNYSEEVLDKMAIVLYVNLERKKEAIAQLETHTRVHGCSERICARLIGFYSNENNIEGLLSVYLRMYTIHEDKEVAKKIVQIYTYQKEYMKLMQFLEESGVDDTTLLQLYLKYNDFLKASELSYAIYLKSSDVHFLGQSAILEYQATANKNDKKMLKKVVATLEDVLRQSRTPMYLNYLGYLLIDHEINIKKGMGYIREALKDDPKSGYYLDSLAWGYYKLGSCEKAKKLIKKVLTLEGGDDAEVVSHYKIIQKCTEKKTKKGKKKK